MAAYHGVPKTRWSHVPITFSQEDLRGLDYPHNDALVISADVAGLEVRRVLVDGGSSADVLFLDAYVRMGLPSSRLRPPEKPLVGFNGQPMDAVGQITLSVTFGQDDNARTEDVVFDVVDLHYLYNAIFGRASLNRFEAIPHHNYLCMKMPGPKGVITVWGD
jgi:hypothetical protein